MREGVHGTIANDRQFETAISSFKACVSHELRSLCQRGHSRRNAIGIILTRICNTAESPVSTEEEESAETLAIAEKLSLPPEEALRALVVERQAMQMMAAGTSRVDVLNALIERVTSGRKSSAGTTGPQSPSPGASAEALVETEVHQAPAAGGARILTESLPTNAKSPSPTKPMKRPRKASEGGKDAADSSCNKQDDLSRQIQKLSAEINEAMRGGDRGKVSLLMRQRDQLQQMRGCLRPRAADVVGKEQRDAEPEPALKRARA